jgi:site-specific DNA-methyltransferase (adenine-specific)
MARGNCPRTHRGGRAAAMSVGMKAYYADEYVTIYHGDCREIAPSLRADAVVSDPPYGMKWNVTTSRFSGGSDASKGKRGAGRDDAVPVYGDDGIFDPLPWLAYRHVVLWGFHHFAAALPVGSVLVWLKRLDGAFGSFLSDAELAWMKGGHGVYCWRDLSMTALAKTRAHPTQKPVSLMQWCITTAGVEQHETILDPFAGSGSTLRAAKDLGRKSIGIEIYEPYCEIAAERCRQEILDLGVA